MKPTPIRRTLLCGLLITFINPGSMALATIPYAGAGGPFPGFGPGIIAPPSVGGKEFSHDRDYAVTLFGPPDTIADPQQIVAFDGMPGASGVVDVTDYSGTRPMYTPDDQIDAIANRGDFAYDEVKSETAHLLFSLDDRYNFVTFGGVVPGMLPPGTPPGVVVPGNGNVVGGSGEISYELGLIGGNPADFQALWAPQADVNGMPLPDDVDGLEVWGPEPPAADADKYSLELDVFSFGTAIPGDAVSVWNASGTPYVPHSSVVAAVTALLGPIPATAFLPGPDGTPEHEDIGAINLDALMVRDVIEDPDSFDRGPGGPVGPGPGDEIIFSIDQIVDPMDPDGFYATGSELFIMNAGAPPMFLAHGGHLWDHAYTIMTFGGTAGPGQQVFAFDINAIEAVGQFAVPEPTSLTLLLVGLVGISCGRKRN